MLICIYDVIIIVRCSCYCTWFTTDCPMTASHTASDRHVVVNCFHIDEEEPHGCKFTYTVVKYAILNKSNLNKSTKSNLKNDFLISFCLINVFASCSCILLCGNQVFVLVFYA